MYNGRVICTKILGVVVQMSADGATLLLLLGTRDTYVAVLNLRTNKITHELPVSGCYVVLLWCRCQLTALLCCCY